MPGRSEISLSVLGPPQLKRDNRIIKVARHKAMALLVYLAVSGQRHSRDALAALFWPETGQSPARANLRRCLNQLRSTLGRGWLASEQDNLRLRAGTGFRLDLSAFREALAACRGHGHPDEEVCSSCLPCLSEAVSLYQNDFLFGFSLRDCPEFDRWQFFQAEDLRGELDGALERLSRALGQAGSYDRAVGYARRRLVLDPLHEPAHRALMELYALHGRTAAALRQYRDCCRVLESELGSEPEQETRELARRIRERSLVPPQTGPEQRAEPREEIRIVTALQVGFSPAGESSWQERLDDSAGILAPLLAGVRQILAAQEAHLQPLYAEDLLAVFGVRRSREEDAERALAAALSIRELARRSGLGLSAGIHTGAAYLSPAQSDVPSSPAVLGPVVNRAARLRYQAGEGEILVGEPTYRRCRGAFFFEPAALRLPGGGEEVKAFTLLGPRPHPQKSYGIEGLEARLIGRNRELGELQAALAALAQGSGRFMAVVGEAGIGKSRLLAELKRRSQSGEREVLWLEGRSTEMTATVGYAPFLELLERLFEGEEGGLAGRIARFLEGMQRNTELSAEQLEEVGAVLGLLLSVRYGSSWDRLLEQADPRQLRHRSFQALQALLAGLCRRQPLVLLLDDLHWADSLSIDLITLLLESVPSLPLLLICSYRPEAGQRCRDLPAAAARKCPGRWAELLLTELAEADSRRLTESLLGPEQLPSSLKSLIFRKSLGVPLFQEEILRALIDEGTIRREKGVWRLCAAASELAVPERVQSITQSRLDRLAAPLRQLLQQAAVAGETFSTEVLKPIASLDLEQALGELAAQAFLLQERSVPDSAYGFRHVLIQEAVYQTVPQPRRGELHRLIGESMERVYAGRLEERVDQLAYHFSRSDDPVKAVHYLLRAGDKARRGYSNEEACRCFREALRLLDKDSAVPDGDRQRLTALQGLIQVHLLTYQLDEAEGELRQAVDLARRLGLTAGDIVRLYAMLAYIYAVANRVSVANRAEEMIRIGSQGLVLLGQEGESVETVLMNVSVATGY